MSSKKQQFSSSALDDLVNESIAEADALQDELKEVNVNEITLDESGKENFDDYIVNDDKNWGETGGVINKETGESISFDYVYNKICKLIDTGDATLQMIQSIDLDVVDPQILTASATLMNTIRGCITEFTRIHQQWVRFNQTLKLEKIKFEHKKELMKYKHNLINGIDVEPQDVQGQPQVASNDMIEVKSSDLIEFMLWKKEKEAREKEKENKI